MSPNYRIAQTRFYFSHHSSNQMFSFSRDLLSICDPGILTSIIWFCHHFLSLHHHLQPGIGSRKMSCITSAHLSPVRASHMGKPRCKAGWELQFLIGKLFPRDLSIVEKELRLEGHQPTTTHHLVPHNGEKTPRKSCFLFKRKDPSLFFNIYLFIFWLRRVLVVAHRISAVARGFLSSVAHRLQRTGFSSCGVQA